MKCEILEWNCEELCSCESEKKIELVIVLDVVFSFRLGKVDAVVVSLELRLTICDSFHHCRVNLDPPILWKFVMRRMFFFIVK